VAALKASTKQRLAAGRGELDLGLGVATEIGSLKIVASRANIYWDALCRPTTRSGFTDATGGDGC
jgi:hypothetical protein